MAFKDMVQAHKAVDYSYQGRRILGSIPGSITTKRDPTVASAQLRGGVTVPNSPWLSEMHSWDYSLGPSQTRYGAWQLVLLLVADD